MSSTETTTDQKRYIGQVKWFNNRAGYGFITMTDESGVEKDIFAHFSTIKMEQSQYKFLVQGEYVEFELSTSVNEAHEFQATHITGIKGGSLMCETRQQNRTVAPPSMNNRPPYRRNYVKNRDSRSPRDTRDPRRDSAKDAGRGDDDGFQRVDYKRRSKNTP